MNSVTTQRADELAATDPVNRARLDRRLELVDAAFEHGTGAVISCGHLRAADAVRGAEGEIGRADS
eukprot:scaffold66842_cov97-Phaeocystis_antarctica.AAC.1